MEEINQARKAISKLLDCRSLRQQQRFLRSQSRSYLHGRRINVVDKGIELTEDTISLRCACNAYRVASKVAFSRKKAVIPQLSESKRIVQTEKALMEELCSKVENDNFFVHF